MNKNKTNLVLVKGKRYANPKYIFKYGIPVEIDEKDKENLLEKYTDTHNIERNETIREWKFIEVKDTENFDINTVERKIKVI